MKLYDPDLTEAENALLNTFADDLEEALYGPLTLAGRLTRLDGITEGVVAIAPFVVPELHVIMSEFIESTRSRIVARELDRIFSL